MEARQSFEKARNIEASILKKLSIWSSTESSAVGVRSKTVCKGMRSDAEEGVAKGWKFRKMEENVEKTMQTEEKMNGKLGETKENWGNCWENEEIAGRTFWKNRRKAGKGLKKRHEMEERQSFEKTRNIEASILKKLRIRSSTESSVRWGSEQDSLQGDEEWSRGRSGEGLQSKDKCEKKEHAGTFQTANLDHSLGYRDISLQNQKDSG